MNPGTTPQSGGEENRGPRLRDRILASMMSAAAWVFAWLPSPIAYALADLLAVPWALYWLVHDRQGRRSRGYWRNVRIVFRPGGAATARPRRHLWKWSRHLAWVLVDFCRMRRITAANLRQRVDLSEVGILQELTAEGRGVIVASGHIGAWDMASRTGSLIGLHLISVYRPSPVPAVDIMITRLRSAGGQDLLLRAGAIWRLKQALARGQLLGMAVDGGSKGSEVFTPFLGTPAASTVSPALLHLATGAPIVVLSCPRTGRGRYRIRIHDVIRSDAGRARGSRRAAMHAITARINDGLSRAILEAPEQWFWQNNRFRHRPPGEVPDADGLPPVAGTPPTGR